MIRHDRDTTGGEHTAEIPTADFVEQHQSTDPIDLAQAAIPDTPPPVEADPTDATEQAEAIALDDELRATLPPAATRSDRLE